MSESTTAPETPVTLGFSRCNVNYKDDAVTQLQIAQIRQAGADFIDMLEGFKNAIMENNEGKLPAGGEAIRLFAEAYTCIETGVMFGIKAVTK